MIAQIAAVIIFVVMFVMIILETFERQIVTLAAGALTIVVVFGLCMHSFAAIWKTLNLATIFTTQFWYSSAEMTEEASGINWATIIFIAGMMIMVEGMARVGFFRWLCMTIAKMVHYKTISLFLAFMIISAVLSMFIDSITVILFLAAVTVELAKLLKFDPIPMIMAEIFCANLGGSSTMCGDPPNIIIGTSLHYTFMDFLTNTGLVALIGLVVTIAFFYFSFRKELHKSSLDPSELTDLPEPSEIITDKKGFIVSTVIFLLAVVLLITHAQTGLTVATIGTFIAVLTLVTSAPHAKELLKKVDYHTLLFFIGLFIVVGGLEQTGILEIIADFIAKISMGNVMLMIAIIIWISGIASAFIDNIPFAATMVPIIRSLAATQGVDLSVLAWSLAIGTDIGGSATPIGASANVVGSSVAAREGYPVGWGRYCKYMAPASVIVMALATVIIWVRYL